MLVVAAKPCCVLWWHGLRAAVHGMQSIFDTEDAVRLLLSDTCWALFCFAC